MRVAVILALLPLPALAGEPYCAVEQTCTVTSDNCQPAEGRIEIKMQANGKGMVVLDGTVMGEGPVLGMGGVTALIFTTQAGVQNQLRIQNDTGTFTYLISTPDPAAHKGKDQILYRGQCVEG